MENNSETPKTASPNNSKNLSIRDVLKDIVQEYLVFIDKFHAPYWNARTELVKRIISLASASIVITVTFSGSLVNLEKKDLWNYLLFGSWLLFLLSIISGILSLWFSTLLKAAPMHFISFADKLQSIAQNTIQEVDTHGQARGTLRSELENEKEQSDRVNEMIATVENTIRKAFYPDIWAQRLLAVSLITFILALIFLGLFGWCRFTT